MCCIVQTTFRYKTWKNKDTMLRITSDRWALKSQVSGNPVAALSFPFPKFPRFIRLGKGLSKRRPDGSNGACRGRGQSGHLLVIFWLCLSVRCNFYPPSLGTVHVWTQGGNIVHGFTMLNASHPWDTSRIPILRWCHGVLGFQLPLSLSCFLEISVVRSK